MDLRQLRYLRAVVRLGSVTSAAASEHVAQPAISKQLASLERELGVPLFHRVGPRVVPTDAALQLADCADRVVDDLAATVAAISAGSAAPQRLTLAATETIVDHLLPAALSTLLARYPRLSVSVEMVGAGDALRRVLEDQADFAIVPLPVLDRRLEVEPLFEEPVLLTLPAGHPLARRDPVPLAAALADAGLLLSMPGHGLRATLEAAAGQLGLELPGRLELRSQQALLAMVAAGGGIAFAPAIALARRHDVVARTTEPGLRRELGWVRRRGRHVSAAAADLLAGLRRAASGARVESDG